jgi:hypothetical protein
VVECLRGPRRGTLHYVICRCFVLFGLPITGFALSIVNAEPNRSFAREGMSRQLVRDDVAPGSPLACLRGSAERHAPHVSTWLRGQEAR